MSTTLQDLRAFGADVEDETPEVDEDDCACDELDIACFECYRVGAKTFEGNPA